VTIDEVLERVAALCNQRQNDLAALASAAVAEGTRTALFTRAEEARHLRDMIRALKGTEL
jgi:hypothetical protein